MKWSKHYQHEEREKREPRRAVRPQPPPAGSLDLDGWSYMHRYLKKRGLNYDLAVFNKWYPAYDKNDVLRIVMPAENPNGPVFWQARALGDESPKYISPSYPRGASLIVVFPKTKVVGTVVVEGPMDALAAAGTGYVGVSTMGNNPSSEALAHLLRYPEPFVVVPDADAPEFISLVGPYLTRAKRKMFVRLPLEKDLAAMTQEQRGRLLRLEQ